MIDHAPYFRELARAEQENRIIAELDKHAAPLHWMLIIALLLVAASKLWGGWEYYADLAAQNEVMVQCLNGKTIGLGDAVLRCEVRQLVQGGSHGL